PNAQQVLFGGRVPNISVFGQGELTRLQLARFDGEIGLSEISNGFVDVHGAKVRVAGDLGRWTLTPRVDSVFVKPEGPWSTLTSHLRGVLPETSPDIVYKDIKGQMELRDGILRWSHLTGRVDPVKAMLGSDGQWLTDGTLQGWIQLEDKTGPVRWIVSGSVRKPSITASEIR